MTFNVLVDERDWEAELAGMAARLGKSIAEILEMPDAHLSAWNKHFEMQGFIRRAAEVAKANQPKRRR